MNSAFAIFIYQATDKGCGNKFRAQLVLRANQGLIFQHGILYELLGNERVCALVEEGVEYPETMSRIAHIKIDDEDKWIQILIKRMRNAGLDIPLLNN